VLALPSPALQLLFTHTRRDSDHSLEGRVSRAMGSQAHCRITRDLLMCRALHMSFYTGQSVKDDTRSVRKE